MAAPSLDVLAALDILKRSLAGSNADIDAQGRIDFTTSCCRAVVRWDREGRRSRWLSRRRCADTAVLSDLWSSGRKFRFYSTFPRQLTAAGQQPGPEG